MRRIFTPVLTMLKVGRATSVKSQTSGPATTPIGQMVQTSLRCEHKCGMSGNEGTRDGTPDELNIAAPICIPQQAPYFSPLPASPLHPLASSPLEVLPTETLQSPIPCPPSPPVLPPEPHRRGGKRHRLAASRVAGFALRGDL